MKQRPAGARYYLRICSSFNCRLPLAFNLAPAYTLSRALALASSLSRALVLFLVLSCSFLCSLAHGHLTPAVDPNLCTAHWRHTFSLICPPWGDHYYEWPLFSNLLRFRADLGRNLICYLKERERESASEKMRELSRELVRDR